MENIQLQVRDDGIAILTMDMPGRPLNVFSEAMMDDLELLIDRAPNDFKGMVITSGKSTFVAGADLVMIKDFADMRFDCDWQTMRNRFSRLGRLFRKIEQTPVPIVAAINGLALGGGLELAMACHGRVCIDTPAAILGLPEIVLGLLPGAGGTQRLPRYIGVKAAIEMLLVGNPISPQAALANTLVDELASVEQLVEKAVALAKGIEPVARWDKPGWQLSADDQALLTSPDWQATCHQIGGWANRQHDLYPAVKAIVDIVGKGAGLPIDEGFKVEWDTFVELMLDPVVANMVVTGFLNKTAAPKWAVARVDAASPKPSSVEWQATEPAPKSLARKLNIVDAGGDLVVSNNTGNASNGNASNGIALMDARNWQQPSQSAAFISYVRPLATTEAVEISAPANLSNGVLTLASAMGKVPVWSMTEGGTLNRLVRTVAGTLAKSGLSADEISRAATAIDACPLFGLPDSKEALSAQDRQRGFDLLARIALDARAHCQGQYQALDVLAVLGAGWPKWSGGPVAYLAMLQRGELADAKVSEVVTAAVAALDHPLKVKASYQDAG